VCVDNQYDFVSLLMYSRIKRSSHIRDGGIVEA
jgi:hypothetical protein